MTVEVFLAFIFSALLEMTVTRGEKKIYNTFILGTREREREILIEEAKMNVQNNNNVCLERKFCLLIFHASFTHIYARNICWHYVEWWIISYTYIYFSRKWVKEGYAVMSDVLVASVRRDENWIFSSITRLTYMRVHVKIWLNGEIFLRARKWTCWDQALNGLEDRFCVCAQHQKIAQTWYFHSNWLQIVLSY